MKNGITKGILIGMLLSVTCRVWAESPQLIVEGRNWNYEVEHHGPFYIGEAGDWHRSEYGFHFQGEEEIGGKVYSIFRNGEGEVVAYMREEGGKVYLKTWEESYGGWAFECTFPEDESEVAIYDFNLSVGESAELVGFDDSQLTRAEKCRVEVVAVEVMENSGRNYTYRKFNSYQDDLKASEGTFIDGIGAMRGPLCMPQFNGDCATNGETLSYYLKSVTDRESGEILYDNPFVTGVRSITDGKSSNERMYNLQGISIKEATPGTIVIRNGRKERYMVRSR